MAKRGRMRRRPQAGGRHLKPAAARARPPSRESGRWWWAGSTATTCGTPSPPARDRRQRRPMGLKMLGGVPGGGCGWIALRGGRGGRRGQRGEGGGVVSGAPCPCPHPSAPRPTSPCAAPAKGTGSHRNLGAGFGELRRAAASFGGPLQASKELRPHSGVRRSGESPRRHQAGAWGAVFKQGRRPVQPGAPPW